MKKKINRVSTKNRTVQEPKTMKTKMSSVTRLRVQICEAKQEGCLTAISENEADI